MFDRVRHTALSVAMLAIAACSAACSFDPADNGSDPAFDASTTAPDARATVDAAAPGIDATPVTCSSDADCAVPPDLCHRAGQCNQALDICQYPPVNCAATGDECNAGVCNAATGGCETTPVNEGNQCADTVVGSFGPCSFADTCTLSGTQTRQRTDFACNAGNCEGTTTGDPRTCNRPPGSVLGVSCGDRTCGDCGACMNADPCDEDGTCSRLCNDFECSALGTCDPVAVFVDEDCSRDTDGAACFDCGSSDCECADGVCQND